MLKPKPKNSHTKTETKTNKQTKKANKYLDKVKKKQKRVRQVGLDHVLIYMSSFSCNCLYQARLRGDTTA